MNEYGGVCVSGRGRCRRERERDLWPGSGSVRARQGATSFADRSAVAPAEMRSGDLSGDLYCGRC